MAELKPETVPESVESGPTGAEEAATGPPAEATSRSEGSAEGAATPEQTSAAQATPALPPRHLTVADLPIYGRSLLRIRVPVVVTLAEKRQPLGRIVELGPGSIIHFDKSCEEMLDLDVGGRPIATGEAVKVGDKFGLRINSIILPEERFVPVKPQSSAGTGGS